MNNCPHCLGKGVQHASTGSLLLFKPCPCRKDMQGPTPSELAMERILKEIGR